MSIAEYIEWYILYIPASVYGWGLGAFLAVLLLMMLWKGVAQGVRYASGFPEELSRKKRLFGRDKIRQDL